MSGTSPLLLTSLAATPWADTTFRCRLIDTVRQSVIVTNVDGTITLWNRFAEDLYGWTADEVLGRTILDVTPTEMNYGQAETIMERLRAGETWTGEFLVRRKDGSSFWAEVSDTPILDDEGSLVGIIGTSSDVTERRQMSEELRSAEEKYRSLIECLPLVTYSEQVGTGVVYTSPQIMELLGVPADEWLAASGVWMAHVHPEDRQMLSTAMERTDDSGEPFRLEHRFIARDGRVVWVRNEAILRRDANDGAPHWQGFLLDITDRKQTEIALRKSESQYRTLVDNIPAATYIEMLDGRETIFVSPQIEPMLGYPVDSWIGQRNFWTRITHPDDVERRRLEVERTNETGEPFSVEQRFVKPNGTIVWVQNSAVLQRADDGRPLYRQGFVLDITRQKRLQEQLIHHAFHDALTRLPNRNLLTDRLHQALATARRYTQQVAVLFLDLDNFKVINDSLGHATGDGLLVEVAMRLKRCVREVDTVTRFGGDEFVVVLNDIAGVDDVMVTAERIVASLNEPFDLGARTTRMQASIGIIISDGTDNADDLLRHADIAMYRAKNGGKNRIRVFDTTLNEQVAGRFDLEDALHHAIDDEQFTLFYQPILALASEEIVGMEALVRWNHPERGLVQPADFIPIAEETGLIVPLGLWVVRQACVYAARHGSRYGINVNLSALQFAQRNLVEQISVILNETRLDPAMLTLEITESVLMDDAQESVERLRSLKALGLKIAIDDFGTGYSSLAYLKRFPVDVIKIDRAFVAGLGASEEDKAIVTSIISLAHSLGLTVVAEGVETAGQGRLLTSLGCDRAQGYVYARPLPETDADTLLDTWDPLAR